MNEEYKQSVGIFGIAIPCLIMAAIAGIAFYMSSSTAADFKKKKKAYDKAQIAAKEINELQGKMQKISRDLNGWDNMLKSETRGTFLQHWKETEQKFTGKEFTRNPYNWVNYSDGIGKGLNQPASQVNMSFSATYRAMQLAFLEIETKLPNMQLDSLSIVPEKNGEKINFKTTHTIWTLK